MSWLPKKVMYHWFMFRAWLEPYRKWIHNLKIDFAAFFLTNACDFIGYGLSKILPLRMRDWIGKRTMTAFLKNRHKASAFATIVIETSRKAEARLPFIESMATMAEASRVHEHVHRLVGEISALVFIVEDCERSVAAYSLYYAFTINLVAANLPAELLDEIEESHKTFMGNLLPTVWATHQRALENVMQLARSSGSLDAWHNQMRE